VSFRERKDLQRAGKVPEYIEPVYVEIGARIRWLRQQRDWDLEQAADRLGVHKGTVLGWELGKARVRISELVRLAHAFGAPLEMFLADLRVEDAQPTATLLASREKQKTSRAKTASRKGIAAMLAIKKANAAAKKAAATTKPKRKKQK
jgi:transcriptional regulator with XRE-family HTH domain